MVSYYGLTRQFAHFNINCRLVFIILLALNISSAVGFHTHYYCDSHEACSAVDNMEVDAVGEKMK